MERLSWIIAAATSMRFIGALLALYSWGFSSISVIFAKYRKMTEYGNY